MSILSVASEKSAWRGYEYFCDDKVLSVEKTDEIHYSGAVAGNSAKPYKVVIDLEHPKRSTCDCPFANGRKVCKHMVALFFAAFPDEAISYKADIDMAIEEEKRYREELPKMIEQYVNGLTQSELRDLALTLIYSLSDWELEQFVQDYIYTDTDEYEDFTDEDEWK